MRLRQQSILPRSLPESRPRLSSCNRRSVLSAVCHPNTVLHQYRVESPRRQPGHAVRDLHRSLIHMRGLSDLCAPNTTDMAHPANSARVHRLVPLAFRSLPASAQRHQCTAASSGLRNLQALRDCVDCRCSPAPDHLRMKKALTFATVGIVIFTVCNFLSINWRAFHQNRATEPVINRNVLIISFLMTIMALLKIHDLFYPKRGRR